MNLQKKIVIVIGAVLVAALIVAAVCLVAFRNTGGGEDADLGQAVVDNDPTTFLEGTTINGLDVSGQTPEDAAVSLAARTEGYVFTLNFGEERCTFAAADLGLTYNDATDLYALLEAQNEDLTETAFEVEDLYTVDADLVTAGIQSVLAPEDALEAEPEAEAEELASEDTGDSEAGETLLTTASAGPTDAYITFDSDLSSFVIIPDEPGEDVDLQAIADEAMTAILQLETELTLDPADYRESASVTADDPDLQAALTEANSCLNLQLTYTFTPDGGSTSTVTLSRSELGSFYYVDNETKSVLVDEEMLGNFVSSLVSKYSGSGKTTQFKTTGGSTININVSSAGQSVDSSGLYDDLYQCLSTKTGGTRTAPYDAVSDAGDGYWGGNYVEVDLTAQHLWCYHNGTCVVSCDVVSGCVADGTTTPTGCFTIFAMNTNRYLQGTNVDGTPYKSWVYYFMPFSGGCGIHDATWRSVFGGTEYYYNGSHGCVGVTRANAATIYNNVSVGTHVVVYGGTPASELPGRTQNISVTVDAEKLEKGSTAQITVSGNRGDLSYESSDTAVATVSSSGKITAVGQGTAVITVTAAKTSSYAEATQEITITVTDSTPQEKSAQNLKASAGASSLEVGQTTKITVSGNSGSLTFKSSDASVATVDGTGNVKAVGAGTVTITITAAETSSYKQASTTVTIVVTAPVETPVEPEEPEESEPETSEGDDPSQGEGTPGEEPGEGTDN